MEGLYRNMKPNLFSIRTLTVGYGQQRVSRLKSCGRYDHKFVSRILSRQASDEALRILFKTE